VINPALGLLLCRLAAILRILPPKLSTEFVDKQLKATVKIDFDQW
jgi:hypothetical protein